MVGPPDNLRCTFTDWEQVYDLCRKVSGQVRESEFKPEAIVALARGGWVVGRCFCDFLDLRDLASLKIERSDGIAQKEGAPSVRYPLFEENVQNKSILIVDEIAATGKSLRRAIEHTETLGPSQFQTATLHIRSTSDYTPDYYGEYVEENLWVTYPWNVIENTSDLVQDIVDKRDLQRFSTGNMRSFLREYYESNGAQPVERLPEILREMERRGELELAGEGQWQLPDAGKP